MKYTKSYLVRYAFVSFLCFSYAHLGYACETCFGCGAAQEEMTPLEQLRVIKYLSSELETRVRGIQGILGEHGNYDRSRFKQHKKYFDDALNVASELASLLRFGGYQKPTRNRGRDLIEMTAAAQREVRHLKGPKLKHLERTSVFLPVQALNVTCCCYCCSGEELGEDAIKGFHMLANVLFPFSVPADLLGYLFQLFLPSSWDTSDAHWPKITRTPAQYKLSSRIINGWIQQFQRLIEMATEEVNRIPVVDTKPGAEASAPVLYQSTSPGAFTDARGSTGKQL